VIKGDVRNFRVTSFFGEEGKILKDFNHLLDNHFNQPQHILCGHNAKEFDIPFLARRMIINQIPLPDKLIYSARNHGKFRIWIRWNYGSLGITSITLL
jgi:uncharacterized protein YprB with RNaseH-like and TPR domain